MSWPVLLMRGFIALVFVGCLFGPYALSILIGGLCIGCHLFGNEAGSHL